MQTLPRCSARDWLVRFSSLWLPGAKGPSLLAGKLAALWPLSGRLLQQGPAGSMGRGWLTGMVRADLSVVR